MNRRPNHKILLLTLTLSMLGLFATGCTISATPATVSAAPATTHTTVVQQEVAPARVYHNGRWLYYRTDGYYYSSGSRWVVARSVPTHVTTYHRPGRPTHVVAHNSRPTHVVRHGSRPTHVQRTVTPTRRVTTTRRTTTTRPTHVQRTTTHRSRTTTHRSRTTRRR